MPVPALRRDRHVDRHTHLVGHGPGVAGQTVDFTLDDNPVGFAVTDSNGIATLTGVATTATAGTDMGALVASFAGTTNYAAASNATGDLVVTQAPTTLGSVAGTAVFGGTATLTATLTSSVTGQGVAGQTVDFTLDDNPVGFAVTDSNGIATLTGVATTDAAETDTGAVVASFSGTTNYAAASNATGDLVVSQAPTTLGSVAGTAAFGGTATLTATLTSSVTGLGIPGQTVDFHLRRSAGRYSPSPIATESPRSRESPRATPLEPTPVPSSPASRARRTTPPPTTRPATWLSARTPLRLEASRRTASFGGTAILTALSPPRSPAWGMAGQTVTFTLDGDHRRYGRDR